MLRWLRRNIDPLQQLFGQEFRLERVRLIEGAKPNCSLYAQRLLNDLGITYLAPQGGESLPLSDGSCCLHFSLYTFEHIPLEVLKKVLSEARRVLKPKGLTIHLVDPTDHFAYFDKKLTKINMLKFSSRTWNLLTGDFLAYHNRLRPLVFRNLFESLNFEVVAYQYEVDRQALAALRAGFKLASEFRHFSEEEICAKELLLAGRCSVQ